MGVGACYFGLNAKLLSYRDATLHLRQLIRIARNTHTFLHRSTSPNPSGISLQDDDMAVCLILIGHILESEIASDFASSVALWLSRFQGARSACAAATSVCIVLRMLLAFGPGHRLNGFDNESPDQSTTILGPRVHIIQEGSQG